MLDFGGLGKSADTMAQAAVDIVEKLGNIERLHAIQLHIAIHGVDSLNVSELGLASRIVGSILDDPGDLRADNRALQGGGWELHRDNCTRACFGIDPDTKSCQTNGCEHHPVLV